MMIRAVAIAAVVPLVLVAACRRDPAPTSQSTTIEPPGNPVTQPSREDVEFATQAAKGNLFEVKIGETAKRQAASPEVKAFGTHLVDDHGAANLELKKIADKKGIQLPTSLDEEHAQKVHELGKLSGAKFDEEFSDGMVDDHEEDIRAFEKATENVRDPELRAFAAEKLPTLRHHLDTAKSLKAKTSH